MTRKELHRFFRGKELQTLIDKLKSDKEILEDSNNLFKVTIEENFERTGRFSAVIDCKEISIINKGVEAMYKTIIQELEKEFKNL